MEEHRHGSIISRHINGVRASVRSILRRTLSLERRNELKRLQGVARKRLAPILSMVHGNFTADELCADLEKRVLPDSEIIMVHCSYENLLPMYNGSPIELVSALTKLCGPERTLVMPAFVMGGRNFDLEGYFRDKPFDIRRTPAEIGLLAEVFRRTRGVVRSLHPTCGVCALGPLAKELTTGHNLAKTGLGPGTPFGVMTRRRTAILGLGVEYYRCLTHAHTATCEMGDNFPIKFAGRTMPVTLIDYDGSRSDYSLGLPDPTQKLDLRLIWSLLSKEELNEWRFHGVPVFAVSRAGIVTERLMEAARRGVTIYGQAPACQAPTAVIENRIQRSEA